MEIKKDDLTSIEIKQLLEDHLQSMTLHSPPESIHALDLDGLRQPEVTFWSVWEDEELLGCGAIKELAPDHGEVKSMKTSSDHIRKGVGRLMLNYIIAEARNRGYKRLSLETGSMEAFLPARHMYEKAGFHYCEPFADYVPDPNSLFMTLKL
ncbi:GNAT family N-acetyltransferase [Cytobacillus gottheilii]|uniref:GNAT family N-acetyltransferase n=1 Tax=Cytobacillus gottheilii TaxID=859144 RepID=A0ABX8FBS7_9BACI|nr:GNAT family N-acetyltransferase [Cytobacillus gottheilii]QVY61835.1 GNAT family N-acetyltransferase [Cytobacillus gottheilii]